MNEGFTIEYRCTPTAHNRTETIHTTNPEKFLCLSGSGSGFSLISMSEAGRVHQRLAGNGVEIEAVYVLSAKEKQIHYKDGGLSPLAYHLSARLRGLLTEDVPEVLACATQKDEEVPVHMDTFVEMYNDDQYTSWDEAKANGAIYSSVVHTVDEPESITGKALLDDMMEAAHTAADMMFSGAKIITRVVRRHV